MTFTNHSKADKDEYSSKPCSILICKENIGKRPKIKTICIREQKDTRCMTVKIVMTVTVMVSTRTLQ